MRRWFAICAVLGLPAASHSQLVCSASDIALRESSCSPTGVCTIRGTHVVGDQCVLDFGSRPVVFEGTARLVVGSGSVRVIAGSLLLRSGALLDARGQGTQAPTNRGGAIRLEIAGPVVIEGGSPRARIDASGNSSGGWIDIVAAGTVEIAGRVLASHLTASANGGRVDIESEKAIRVLSTAELSATGGVDSQRGGGTIELDAAADVSVGAEIVVSGSEGGRVVLDAGGTVTVGWVRANATGAGGAGGSIALTGYRGVSILGGLRAQGNNVGYSEGGDGGTVEITVPYGDLLVAGSILAEGGEPDALGGDITAEVAGSVRVSAPLSVRAHGAYGIGGSVGLLAGGQILSEALIDVSGGSEGGDVTLAGSQGVTVNGGVDGRGRAAGGTGGEVVIIAGDGTDERTTRGNVTVSNTVDVSGGGCDRDGNCGAGGSVKLVACVAQVNPAGRVLARGGGLGGAVAVVGHGATNIDGTINCQRSTASGVDGSVTLSHLNGIPPRIRAGGVLPLPVLKAFASCEGPSSTDCLVPCTECGDGQVRYPEECDDGNRLGCDGCSTLCRMESCDPAADCVECLPELSCPPAPKNPCEPPSSPTVSPSPSPEAAVTPTATSSATVAAPSPTSTLTPSATPTATFTPTRTSTATPTHTGTPTWTRTPTNTPTVTPTPRTRVDVVLEPLRPLRINLKDRTPLAMDVPIRIRQVKSTSEPSGPLGLGILASDCSPESITAQVDVDLETPGNQDRIEFPTGRTVYASLQVVADPSRLGSVGVGLSPYRCHLLLSAAVQMESNQDPTPWNNAAVVELNVTNTAEPWVEQKHQSVVLAARPKRLRFRRGQEVLSGHVRVAVANADRLDIAGHAITLVAADGDCPSGTAGLPVFHRPGVLPVNKAVVPNRGRRFAKLPISLRRETLELGPTRSPYRCTLILEAIGPSGDQNPTDNVTVLTLDIYSE